MIHHPECFAIKPGFDGLLDVARKTYLDNVSSIEILCKEYREQFGEHIALKYA